MVIFVAVCTLCGLLETPLDVFPSDKLFELSIPIVKLGSVRRRRVSGFVRVVDRIGFRVAHVTHGLDHLL